MDTDAIVDELSELDEVDSVRRQPPHYVLTVEHGPLDDPTTLANIQQNTSPDHSSLVDDLPGWTTFEFSNAIEVFVTVDRSLAADVLEEE